LEALLIGQQNFYKARKEVWWQADYFHTGCRPLTHLSG